MRSTDRAVNRFSDWQGVIKKLSQVAGNACAATSQAREGSGTALLLPAACLFTGSAAAPSDTSRPALAAIAAHVAGVTDREFWIAVRGARGGDAGRINRARAEAAVAGLIAGGVPPDRLAALFGDLALDDSVQAATGPGGRTAAGPVIEIVAAPRAFLSAPSQ